MHSPPVITLEDVILHPLLSGFIGLLFLLGIFDIARRIINPETERALRSDEIWCGYFLLLAVLASALHVLAQMGHVPKVSGLVIGWGVCLLGIHTAYSRLSQTALIFRHTKARWLELSVWQRIDVSMIGGVLIFFGVMTMTPPTDADSMNYHLVLPLEFLRFGEFVPHPEWDHAKLIGLGEYLILAGYLIRTENLSALVQFSGLIAVLVVLVKRAKTTSHRLLVAKLVVAAPVLLFLVANQKPQWAGTAAIVVASSLLTNGRTWSAQKIILVVGATLFACGLKYSFYLAGSGVFLMGLWLSAQSQRAIAFLGVSVVSYGILVFPLHLGNYLHYADPIPPVLTALLTPETDPAARSFYAQINQVEYIPWYEKIVHMVVPHSLGGFTAILGIGIFTVFWVPFREMRARWQIGLLTLYTLTVIEIFGTYQSRYYIDAYLLGVLLFASARDLRRGTTGLAILASAQLFLVAIAAGVGTAKLGPGLISFSHRQNTMASSAEYYPVAAWVDNNLPQSALILNGLRQFSLYPRDTLSYGYQREFHRAPQQLVETIRSRAVDIEQVYLIARRDPSRWLERVGFSGIHADVKLVATVPFERGSRKLGFPPKHDTFYVLKLSFSSR